MISKKIITKSLAFAFVALSSAAVLANPVIQRVGLVGSGPVGELESFLERASSLAGELSPDVTATAVILTNTFHGPVGSNDVSIALTFDSLEDWAEATAKQRGSSEWQQVLQTFPVDNFTVNFQGLSEVVWSTGNATPAADGNVLLVYGVAINGGGLAPMMSYLEGVADAARELGENPTINLLSPIVAGAGTASANIVVRFDSAEAWATASAKQDASRDFQEAFAKFPAQNYTINYRGMSVITALE
ncbi:MAG: hypothetical protein ACI8XU_002540 [Kiritimatiellia bacterium]|jgi:hypothetical protein